MSELIGKMKAVHGMARVKLKTSLKGMKRDYDLKDLLIPYAEGDIVYILDTAVLKGKCRKLCSHWKGPGIIMRKITTYLYQVKLKSSFFVTNHDMLLPCRERNTCLVGLNSHKMTLPVVQRHFVYVGNLGKEDS